MTAPALVLVSNGPAEIATEQVVHALRKEMQIRRPELSIHLAFCGKASPTGKQTLKALDSRGTKETVLVPLDFTSVASATEDVVAMHESLKSAFPQMKIGLAKPIGPVSELLNIVDERLRAALTANRCLELDGLVLAAPSFGDTRGSGVLLRRARQWSSHHKLPVVFACGDGTGSSVKSAISSLHDQGRRSIAVGSLFLTPDDCYQALYENALANRAIAISSPFGPDPRLCNLIMARYSFEAMKMLDMAFENQKQAPSNIAQLHLG
ncbi:sirohydrochlorin chelatase [Propionimicrobium sp. BV2F7]|uniref:sirohydrochlorin chelatase n=1 Tax=Propionimicrobium sp. BV2F7 TaxID=1111131 RepID=UPI0003D798B8|nr:CbiX/SirB N-terminal domain-containing protein [Propionimicrobium sp. BV2F7]ETJ98088.1 sirohydrochlorin cobaltochelatase [Propionimicrobium sp. BV2F7]